MKELTAKQKKRIERIATLIEQGPLAIAQYLFEIEDKIDEEVPNINTLLGKVKGDKGDDGEKGDPGLDGVDGIDGKDGRDGLDGKDGRDGLDGKDGRDGLDGKDGRDGLDGKDGSPDTAEQIVEKINSLPEDEEDKKIDVVHIKGLKEFWNELFTKNTPANSISSGAGGGGTAGKTVRYYDLSSQLDGVTKTFNLPALWRVISVHSSSFPYSSFRDTVDFTWTGQSITFTSQIDAATTLASGQSLIIVYAE